jgi:hypothetical protein
MPNGPESVLRGHGKGSLAALGTRKSAVTLSRHDQSVTNPLH